MLDSGELHSDSLFQELLGQDYEKRTLRYMVVEELFPITDLDDPEDLRHVFRDIIKCHRWLVNVPRILHRDISVNNLMFRPRGDRKFGVLNDFDLACTIEEVRRATSKQRTGTKPFIAMDLLELDESAKGPHFIRYDLESIVYVFAWIVCVMSKSERSRIRRLRSGVKAIGMTSGATSTIGFTPQDPKFASLPRTVLSDRSYEPSNQSSYKGYMNNPIMSTCSLAIQTFPRSMKKLSMAMLHTQLFSMLLIVHLPSSLSLLVLPSLHLHSYLYRIISTLSFPL
ncbi:hypothetical protein L218DRAFT_883375 [Marasmius fiardii PR-910]|nr:hypothetical protein L218DRAFT_883375 [Marasmius fiardii PR-910]